MSSELVARGPEVVPKAQTGIEGFDDITGGGIPRNRTTAVHGGTGAGKTVFGLQAIHHGARNGEPGVFLSFGESVEETRENGKSIGLDLAALEAEGHLVIDSALVDPEEIVPEGGYTLDAVFVRLEQAIERIGAKRVVIDALNVIEETIPHPAIVRAGLRRLLNGLKDRGITVIATVEVSGRPELRVEEFLADCVIHLSHAVVDGIATRRLRVVKYRGSPHRVNEYAFLISGRGMILNLLTEAVADQDSSAERISVGITGVDEMLGGGVFRGDTVLVSGSAGSGKTSVTVSIAVAACDRGEKALFIAMEEPPAQLVRNMGSIGIDLGKWTQAGLLRIHAPKPSLEGLEAHVAFVLEEVAAFQPDVVVLDPLTPFMAIGQPDDVREATIRLLSLIKAQGITGVCTLLAREEYLEEQNTPFASFVDDIFLVVNVQEADRRHRTFSVLKARGTAHDTSVHEFAFTSDGLAVGKTENGTPSKTRAGGA